MSSLEIDTSTLRGIASNLRGIAGAVPKAAPVDIDDAGSAKVAAAAESFNMWAKVTGMVLAGKITALASDADTAATAFENADDNAADAVTGP